MERVVLNELSYFGAGSRNELANVLRMKGFEKVFVVTDSQLVNLETFKKVEEVLQKNAISYQIFSEIKPNPTVSNVREGLYQYRESGADVILAVGGGSAIDTAKAIAVVANNPEHESVITLEGAVNTRNKCVPIIAMPTTAGTAAEVTINYVITDEERQKKMVCVDPNDIPFCSIVDAELMVTMPKGITASTGMDALTHAIECLITKGATAMSDMFALEAIRNIAYYLPRAVEKGDDIVAREKMAYAQYVAGMGFSNVGLGIVHSMAHPLGGRFDIAHGVANAMLLPTVMEYNLNSPSKTKYRLIAIAFGEDITGLNDDEAGKKAIEAVEKLKMKVGIPANLSSLGIKESDLTVLSEDAYNDVCTGGNPRETSIADIYELYKKVL